MCPVTGGGGVSRQLIARGGHFSGRFDVGNWWRTIGGIALATVLTTMASPAFADATLTPNDGADGNLTAWVRGLAAGPELANRSPRLDPVGRGSAGAQGGRSHPASGPAVLLRCDDQGGRGSGARCWERREVPRDPFGVESVDGRLVRLATLEEAHGVVVRPGAPTQEPDPVGMIMRHVVWSCT